MGCGGSKAAGPGDSGLGRKRTSTSTAEYKDYEAKMAEIQAKERWASPTQQEAAVRQQSGPATTVERPNGAQGAPLPPGLSV